MDTPKLPDTRKTVCHQPLLFRRKNTQYRLVRLTDNQHYRFLRSSIAIEQDHFTYFDLIRLSHNRKDPMTLAEAYLSLKSQFGESSSIYDQYKSSFCFPFSLQIERSNSAEARQTVPYFLAIRDYKGAFEFNLRRSVDSKNSEIERGIYHKPFEDEFSGDEIDHVFAYLYGFIQGYGTTIPRRHNAFFYHKIRAILSVYGYMDGQFFECSFHSEEEYDQAIVHLQQNSIKYCQTTDR